ncbi:type II secretion system GspH family protein [Paraglaciecola aquimarina]|uniref:Type II secretion system GspH family protein n=1 Tax=Paraglaciecola algarum TaxID=3050085 RepID=A0ABS9D6A8_9ALTE|nr:type II secretion system protein [Paraglaciecola sp. G1-23]MCF2947364.1 type II secretion system GspH family protein [Paraglaciecola sp. G1-23]
MPATKNNGFTLVELIIGLVVFSIAMTLFVSLIVPQAIRSVEPIFQVRAAELGQALISEISSKPFDENSSRVGGYTRCNEGTACTSINSVTNSNIEEGLGNREQFDDVDDYNNLNESGANIKNSLGATTNLYQGFSARVKVSYDADMDGGNPDTVVGNIKLITVTITTPNNEDIIFSAYRANY